MFYLLNLAVGAFVLGGGAIMMLEYFSARYTPSQENTQL